MANVHSIGNVSAASTGVDRLTRRLGLGLVTWSQLREVRRAERLTERSGDRARTAGILDPDAPRAVRAFGFTPGNFR